MVQTCTPTVGRQWGEKPKKATVGNRKIWMTLIWWYHHPVDGYGSPTINVGPILLHNSHLLAMWWLQADCIRRPLNEAVPAKSTATLFYIFLKISWSIWLKHLSTSESPPRPHWRFIFTFILMPSELGGIQYWAYIHTRRYHIWMEMRPVKVEESQHKLKWRPHKQKEVTYVGFKPWTLR